MRLRRWFGVFAMGSVLVACSSNAPSPAADATASSTSGTEVADVPTIQGAIETQIDQKTGIVGTRLSCPARVSWAIGDSFHCDAVGPEGPLGIVNVTLDQAGGRYAWYLTNTCSGERDILGTPRPGCVDPQPSDTSTCPYENGSPHCPAEESTAPLD